jgi:redox-sensitive bicupin YhaK (pirin superfamily)
VSIQAGQTAVLTAATPVADGTADTIVIEGGPSFASSTGRMEVLVLGGAPIREQIAWYGPFVMNTREEIDQAITDYQQGRMGVIQPKHVS